MNISPCGIDCDACKFKTEQNCPGCRAHKGRPFWGVCDHLYDCTVQKSVSHCGQCGDFPCQALIDAHKSENPDGNGIEIETLKKLAATESKP